MSLMNYSCYVLTFTLAPATDMDAQRIYTRRKDPVTGLNQRLACRVSKLSSQESFLHGIRGSEVTHMVYFLTEPNLREENRLEINGLQYIIIGVPDNPSQANRLWEVTVKMVTQQNENATIIE